MSCLCSRKLLLYKLWTAHIANFTLLNVLFYSRSSMESERTSSHASRSVSFTYQGTSPAVPRPDLARQLALLMDPQEIAAYRPTSAHSSGTPTHSKEESQDTASPLRDEGAQRFPSRIMNSADSASTELGSYIPAVSDFCCVDHEDGAIRREMISLISGWLEENNFPKAHRMLLEEAGVRHREQFSYRKSLRAIAKGILEGDWDAVAQVLATGVFTQVSADGAAMDSHLAFLLAEQQLLEIVDSGDSQKAFSFFIRKVKPLESTVHSVRFSRLAYLITCKSIHEASVKHKELIGWSVRASRERLIGLLREEVGDSHIATEGWNGDVINTDTFISRHAVSALPERLQEMVTEAIAFRQLRKLCHRGDVAVTWRDDGARGGEVVPRSLSVVGKLSDDEPLSVGAKISSAHHVFTTSAADSSTPLSARAISSLSYCAAANAIICGTETGTISLISCDKGSKATPLVASGFAHKASIQAITLVNLNTASCLVVVGDAFGVVSLWSVATVKAFSFLAVFDIIDSQMPPKPQFSSATIGIQSLSLTLDGSLLAVGKTTNLVSFWSTNVARNRYGAKPTPTNVLSSNASFATRSASVLLVEGDEQSSSLEALGRTVLSAPPSFIHYTIVGNGSATAAAIVELHFARHGFLCYALTAQGQVHCIDSTTGTIVRSMEVPSILSTGRATLSPNARHGYDAVGMSVSPQGQHVAVLYRQGAIRIWDCFSGGIILAFTLSRDSRPELVMSKSQQRSSQRANADGSLFGCRGSIAFSHDRPAIAATDGEEVVEWSLLRSEWNRQPSSTHVSEKELVPEHTLVALQGDTSIDPSLSTQDMVTCAGLFDGGRIAARGLKNGSITVWRVA